jgi:hypothetical protein
MDSLIGFEGGMRAVRMRIGKHETKFAQQIQAARSPELPFPLFFKELSHFHPGVNPVSHPLAS